MVKKNFVIIEEVIGVFHFKKRVYSHNRKGVI